MTVSAVTCGGAAVPFAHDDDRLRITLPTPSRRGRRALVHDHLSRRPGRRPAPHQQHPRRAHGVQRELAGQRPPVAADDRPPLRQGHGRVHRHGAGPLSGGGQRPARRRDGPPRRSAADALEAVGADRVVALRARHRALHGAALCGTSKGVPLQVWVFPQDADDRPAGLRVHRPPRVRLLQRADRPVLLREAGPRAGRRPQWRHRARDRDLLRREGRRRRATRRSSTRSRTSGGATPSPSATGTTCG